MRYGLVKNRGACVRGVLGMSFDEGPADAAALIVMTDSNDPFNLMRCIEIRAVADNQLVILIDGHLIGYREEQAAIRLIGDDALPGSSLWGGEGAKIAGDVRFLPVILAKFKVDFKGFCTGAAYSHRMFFSLKTGNRKGFHPAAGPASDGDRLFPADEVFLSFCALRGLAACLSLCWECHCYALKKMVMPSVFVRGNKQFAILH